MSGDRGSRKRSRSGAPPPEAQRRIVRGYQGAGAQAAATLNCEQSHIHANHATPPSPTKSGQALVPPDAAAAARAIGGKQTYRRQDCSEAELFRNHTAGIDFSKYDNIDASVSPSDVPPAATFAELRFDPRLQANVARCGYQRPTPVQKYAIPVVLAGRDLMACAQTGSGKTAAFLLPALNFTLAHAPSSAPCSTATPTSLIMAPTRELAIQIYDEGRKFTYQSGMRCVVIYGGASASHQIAELQQGCALVVATPGRLWEMYENRMISFEMIRFLVLDEADRMLDMGFEKQIRQIVESRQSNMPPIGQRQTLLYSATFPQEIQTLAKHFLAPRHYFVKIGRVGSTTDNITQKLMWVDEGDKRDRALEVIRQQPGKSVLVFVDKKHVANKVEKYFNDHGVASRSIHGNHNQKKREDALERFRRKDVLVLVATDVAGRGLDLPDIGVVLQMDLTKKIDDYVHRIGRTGRAGKTGEAIAFVNDNNYEVADDLARLMREASQPVPEFLNPMLRANRGQYREVLSRLKAESSDREARKQELIRQRRAASNRR